MSHLCLLNWDAQIRNIAGRRFLLPFPTCPQFNPSLPFGLLCIPQGSRQLQVSSLCYWLLNCALPCWEVSSVDKPAFISTSTIQHLAPIQSWTQRSVPCSVCDGSRMYGFMDTGMDTWMQRLVALPSLLYLVTSFLTFAPNMYILASSPLHTVARGSVQHTI